jgi:ABC-type branched-subunit amino acid transport system substrate-binding protein
VNKKLLFIPLALLLALSLIAIGCPTTPASTTPPTTKPPTTTPPPPTKTSIIVGMTRPLSGPLAIIGDSGFKPIYDTMVAEWNADGGIYLSQYGTKLPVELKIYDDKSDVGTMTRLTEKLILEDKVDFLWPSCGTSFIFGQAPIANKYGYVLLTAEGGATTITDSLYSLPYTFISLSYSDWYQLPVFADMLAAQGAKTAYVTYIADLHGIEYSGVAGREFGRVGIKILGNVSLPADLKDFAPVITDAAASKADVFCCFGYPDQVLPVTGTSIALGYNPKAFICGPGANFGFYHTAFGPAVNGVTCFATANRKTSTVMAQMYDTLYTGQPEDINDWWGHPLYWGAYQYWKQAVEMSGSTDQDDLRSVFASQHFDTVLGDTYFTTFGDGGGLMAKESQPGEIGQWQNEICEIVGGGPWPATVLTADFIYPKPPWPAQ